MGNSWTTNDELTFLRFAGTGAWDKDQRPRNRLQVLQGYLASMEERVNWGELNVAKITRYVETEIHRLLAGMVEDITNETNNHKKVPAVRRDVEHPT